jgi:hypothetical protein
MASHAQKTFDNDTFFYNLIRNGVITVSIDNVVTLYDGTVLTHRLHEGGYVRVHFNRVAYGKRTIRLHRLVWIARRGMIPFGMFINHRDEDKTNNDIMNLELNTHSENMKHRSRSVYPRLTEDQAISILHDYYQKGMSCKAIDQNYPCHYNTINDLTRGKTFKHLDYLRVRILPLAA